MATEVMKKNSGMKDLTVGKPFACIVGFWIPVFLGTLFQQFYNMVDTMIVGKYLGLNQLAGVGVTGSLSFLVIGFCTGICSGFAIPVAQSFGAKDEQGLRRYVTNSVWYCIRYFPVVGRQSFTGCISCDFLYPEHWIGSTLYSGIRNGCRGSRSGNDHCTGSIRFCEPDLSGSEV